MTDGIAVITSALKVVFQRWGQEVYALNGVDTEVPHGQWLMVIGDNGSGKSTYLRALSGRYPPTSGSVSVCGVDAVNTRQSKLASLAYYMHQNPLLGTAPSLTLFENLFVADDVAKQRSRNESYDLYQELLRPYRLHVRGGQLVQSFSGGERQLVSLLIAELRQNPVLLLDEPFSALDPDRRHDCLGIVSRLHQAGRTIIQVTHDHDLAMERGDRTIRFAEGRVEEVTRSTEVNNA